MEIIHMRVALRSLALSVALWLPLLALAGCAASADTGLLTWSDPSQSRSWKPVGAKGTYGTIYTTSLGFDAGGNLLTAVQDYDGVSGNSYATVLRCTGGSWGPLGNVRFSPGQADSVVLGIDNKGATYAAFSDTASGGRPVVVSLVSGSWVMVGGAPSPDPVSDIAIAFDSSNVLYLAYADQFYSGQVRVQKWDPVGLSWILVGSGFATPGSAGNLSLGTDRKGRIYLAFEDFSYGNQLSVSVWDAASPAWMLVGGQGFSGSAVTDVSLVLDSQGAPWVAFADGGPGYKASVMKYAAGKWSYAGTRGFTPDTAFGLRMTLDRWGTPCVAYSDHNVGDRASAMVLTGNSWIQLGSAGFSDGPIGYPSMAISGDGVPAYAYEDQANGYALTVMEYN